MRLAAGIASVVLAGCGILGASEITVEATNETAEPMVVQVLDGIGPDAVPYGPAHTLAAGESRSVELAVPGDDWVVSVNGGHLIDSTDAGSRRGQLPVTLILSSNGPHWQAPPDWPGTDP